MDGGSILSGGAGVDAAWSVPATGGGGRQRGGPRGTRRQRVLRSAQIAHGDDALSCVVLDISARGARISLRAPAELPDTGTLWLRDGSCRVARVRWARGTLAGLEFAERLSDRELGGLLGAGEAGGGAGRGLAALEAAHPSRWLPPLRAEPCFQDAAVREAAEAAELAMLHLSHALRPHRRPAPA
jgi:hypothetical protein